jgi:hypothetical protein
LGPWDTIQYVSTGLSLVAFAIAAILFAYRARLQNRAQIIESVPPEHRLEAIATTAEFFRVDVSSLPVNQQKDIILAQIRGRAHRDLILASLALVISVLLGAIVVLAVLRQGNQSLQPISPTQSTPAQPTATMTTTHIICLGDPWNLCPRNAVSLPCGSSVSDWAKSECTSFSIEKLVDTAGGNCGRYIARISCTKPVARNP